MIQNQTVTHITPAADLIQQIVAAQAQVHDALVDGPAGPLRSEVGLRDLHPA